MKKIIFLGLLAFLFAALWYLPLSIIKPYAEQSIKGLKLNGASGTAWNGEVKQLIVNNANFENITWKVKPLKSLASFSLKFDFDVKGHELTANGLASITLGKTVIIEDTKFELDAALINKQQKRARLSGEMKGSIKHAVLNKQDLPLIDGLVDWNNAAVSSPLIKLAQQGNYHAIITPGDSSDLNIQLRSSDAPMELSGKITLNKEWLYNTNLNIKTNDANLAAIIGMVGKKQANGMINIKKKGDLKPFIRK